MFGTPAVFKFPKVMSVMVIFWFSCDYLFYIFQSGGNILLEAMQILESMQEKNKVLGGMLLHQNKYVICHFKILICLILFWFLELLLLNLDLN